MKPENDIQNSLNAAFFESNWKRFEQKIILRHHDILDGEDQKFVRRLVDTLLEHFVCEIAPQKSFFRARVIDGGDLRVDKVEIQMDSEYGTYTGWDVDKSRIRGYSNIRDVGVPPIEKIKANRVSDSKTPFLYVADNLYTAIAEVRPSILEVVNVVEFFNILPLKIIWIPWKISDGKEIFMDASGNRDPFLFSVAKALSWAFSRPVSRSYAEQDYYLPTQHLVTELRNVDFEIAGIAYPSFQSHTGMNYAIFNKDQLSLSDKKERIVRVQNIEYSCCDLNDLSIDIKPQNEFFDPTMKVEDVRKIKKDIVSLENTHNGK